MGRLLYNVIINGYRLIATVMALFNEKARRLVRGKAQWHEAFHGTENDRKTVWFHCASVGEFEQARPVIEELKVSNPSTRILLSFFSPSGYELYQEYVYADVVCFLPWDSKKNAKRFLSVANPSLIAFVRYEFWYYFLREAASRQIPVFLVSGIFRKDQLFFRTHGRFYLSMLRFFQHFFVQNKESEDLLEGVGLKNVTIAGDTRIDRVKDIAQHNVENAIVQEFVGDQTTLIAGSTWPTDERLLLPVIQRLSSELKTIIAPHEIDPNHVSRLTSKLGEQATTYSQAETGSVGDYRFLIIDNVGMLASLYRYGHLAYVGGAFGEGLHSILEPAAYGLPIFFGNQNFSNFQEALDLLDLHLATTVKDSEQLEQRLRGLLENKENYESKRLAIRSYVEDKSGATRVIVKGMTQALQEHQ